jgi:hypothetical protein
VLDISVGVVAATRWLKAEIVDPKRHPLIGNGRLIFPLRRKHDPVLIITRPSLGNSSLNRSLNNREVHGSSVFYEVRAEVI